MPFEDDFTGSGEEESKDRKEESFDGCDPQFSEDGPPAAAADQNAAQEARIRLAIIGRRYESMQFTVAELLHTVKESKCWQDRFGTFAAYVEEEVKIHPRTAQELLKVHKKCRELGIDRSTVDKLGWSKLALVSRHLNQTNKDALLAEVQQSSYSALKQHFGKPSVGVRGHGRKAGRLDRAITDVIRRAITRAARFTHDEDPQTNLEYVARRFVETFNPPAIADARFSNN